MNASEHTTGDILLVDDNSSNLQTLTTMLSGEGYEIRIAKSGADALQSVRQHPPDLILLDVLMPGMNGHEVCQRLKADAATQDIPVIFVTALAELPEKIKGFEVGGVDYITKPFQAPDVLARVKTHLTIRRLQCELQQEAERFRGLADAAFEGIILHDGERIIDLNQAATGLFGYSREDLLRIPLQELFRADVREMLSGGQVQHAPVEPPYVAEARRCDGESFPVEVHSKSIPWRGNDVYVLAMRDISWRHVLAREERSLKLTIADHQHTFGNMVGDSPVMQKVYEHLLRAAALPANIILYGETGTGKELAAHTIFALSRQHKRTFVAVNCSAIQKNLFESQFFGYRKGAFTGADRDTPGLLEQADGGTLFLDEVGELTLEMQAKLLRVLNDHTYTPVGSTRSRKTDMRIIAATNRELRELVRTGQMREDFFHRIHVIAIDLPPLRWHKEDIPLLIESFLAQDSKCNTTLSAIPEQIMKRFDEYNWPGNVRELFNEVHRYLTIGEVELAGSLPASASRDSGLNLTLEGRSFHEIMETVEQQILGSALEQTRGNKARAAKLLGLQRRSLQRKVEKYGL